MNVLGIVIAVLVAVASGDYAHKFKSFGRRDSPYAYKQGPGQTFKDVLEGLEDVMRRKMDLFGNLGSMGSAVRINEEKINRIYQRDIPAIVLSNEQQDALISLLGEEIDSLTSQTLAAQDRAAAALTTASETSNITDSLEDQVEAIAAWNTEQSNTISSINITDVTEDLLQHLKANIHRLRKVLGDLEADTKSVDAFVQSRRCETGTVQVFFEYDQDNIVVAQTFVSSFDVSPQVTLSMTGFADSIDEKDDYRRNRKDNDGKNNFDKDDKKKQDNGKHFDNDKDYDNGRHYDKDELGIRFSVEQITTTGFNVRVRGFSDGRLENRVGTARWTACQNLDRRPS